MENQEMKFADGMGFKTRHEKAPETVRGTIYFNVEKFTKFLQENKDERGWVNTKIMKSKKDGSIYFILDTWKPTPKEEPVPTFEQLASTVDPAPYKVSETGRVSGVPDAIEYPQENINAEDIPF